MHTRPQNKTKNKHSNLFPQTFRDNAVDGGLLLTLQENDLEEEMGVSRKLHRRRIVQGIGTLLRGLNGGGGGGGSARANPPPYFPTDTMIREATFEDPVKPVHRAKPPLSHAKSSPLTTVPPTTTTTATSTTSTTTTTTAPTTSSSAMVTMSGGAMGGGLPCQDFFRLIPYSEFSNVRPLSGGNSGVTELAVWNAANSGTSRSVVIKRPRGQATILEWKELQAFLSIPPTPMCYPCSGSAWTPPPTPSSS
jgi:hypothetical protein